MPRSMPPLQPETLMVGLVGVIARLEFGQAAWISHEMQERLPRWPGADPHTVAEVLALLEARAELDCLPASAWPVPPKIRARRR